MLEKPGGGGLDSGGMCKVKCFLTWRLITLERPYDGVGMVPWRYVKCKVMCLLTCRLIILEWPSGGKRPWWYVNSKVMCFLT